MLYAIAMGQIIITGVVVCVKSILYDYTILDSSSISWFERISMTIILLNCVTLGMYEPCADSAACVTVRCRILEAFDHAIFVFFAAEMCVKVLAMGLVGKSTYLAETWNCLDMFIVFTGSARIEYKHSGSLVPSVQCNRTG